MSIEDATFLVQRGDDKFSCLGKDLEDTLRNGDMLVAQRGDEHMSWVVSAPMPWDAHEGGVFHVKNANEEIELSYGPFTAYDIKGNNRRKITSIGAGEELVFVTPPDATGIFSYNWYHTWDFGYHTDTSKVTRMMELFDGCEEFNSDISDWDTSKVTNMDYMFYGCYEFNQDISQWCVTLIDSPPREFDEYSGFEGDTAKQPQWGTCPRGEDS